MLGTETGLQTSNSQLQLLVLHQLYKPYISGENFAGNFTW